jgi:acyl-CoA synthetase (AMP-forming)/AMP-acid ligase II
MISHGNLIYTIMQIGVAGKVLVGVYTVSCLFNLCTDHLSLMDHPQPPPPNTPEGISVGLAFLPFHHSYGLHTFGFRVFLQQYTSVLLDRWDIEAALKAIPQ